MGWVAGNGDDNDNSKKEPFPVDNLVSDILAQIRKSNGHCSAYNGQDWFCCDAMASCLSSLSRAMELIQTEEVYAQNIHRACGKTKTSIDDAKGCLGRAVCHKNVSKEKVKVDFERVLQRVKNVHKTHCDNLPEEKTTLSTTSVTPSKTPRTQTTPTSESKTTTSISNPEVSTSKPETSTSNSEVSTSDTDVSTSNQVVSTSDPNSSTDNSTITTNISTSAMPNPTMSLISHPTTHVSKTDQNTTVASTTQMTQQPTGIESTTSNFTPTMPTRNTSTPLPSGNETLTGNDPGDTPLNVEMVVMVSVVLVSMLLLLFVFILYVTWWRKQNDENNASNGSSSSSKPFLWSLFHSTKSTSTNIETDIYAEIDEAFMEAVYRADENPSKKPNLSTKSQINMCYEAGLENKDAIIPGRKSTSSSTTSDVPHADFKPEYPDQLHHDKPLIERFRSLHKNEKADVQHPNVLNKVRKRDDMITSFQADEILRRSSEKSITKETKSYMLSRPAFTTIEQKGNTYEDIDEADQKYDVIEEPIYAVPMDKNVYDSSNIDLHHLTRQTAVPDQHYNHIEVYKNQTDFDVETNNEVDEEEEQFYENEGKMMEY